MNGGFDLHILTQPHSEVYCGYFRRLFYGNSLTFSPLPPCYHANPPDFPRLIGPRDYVSSNIRLLRSAAWHRLTTFRRPLPILHIMDSGRRTNCTQRP